MQALSTRRQIGARANALLLAGLTSALGAAAQPAAPADAFVAQAVAGVNLRSFYLQRDLPAGNANEAWAAGGTVFARSGYWNDLVQIGGSYHFSLPLHAPDDKDGTKLLKPGQQSISVLGELYARFKHDKDSLTIGRQEIDMAYQRASGTRSNRSDATYVGKQDNRMVPIDYEAVLLAGKPTGNLNYYGGYLRSAKPTNASSFDRLGAVIGAKGSESAMWLAGLQWSPAPDFWTQAWYHQVSDVLRVGFVDADYVRRLSKDSYWRLGAQYTDQRADGANALTGQAFSTRHAGAYAEFGWQDLTFYGAMSQTGAGADLRMPLTSGPIYTQQLVRSFVRAHERTLQVGLAASLAQLTPGLSAFVDVTSGKRAINPTTGAALADEQEVNVGVLWTYRDKGAALDGLRTRARYGWAVDKTASGDKKTTDLRLDLNLPIKLF